MQLGQATTDKLPFGVLQAFILTLEEIGDKAKAGIQSAKLQIAHTQRLQLPDRERMMPVVKGQLYYWETVVKAINWISHSASQRLQWIPKLREMEPKDLYELGIDNSLMEAMEWNT